MGVVAGQKTPWTVGAILLAVLKTLPGFLVVMLGGWTVLCGFVNLTDHDADGYVVSEPATFERPSAAIVIAEPPPGGERLVVLGGGLRCRAAATDPALDHAIVSEDVLFRVQGVTRAPGALFLGVAPAAAADEYLAGVAHDAVTEVEFGDGDCEQVRNVVYTSYEGTSLPAAPGAEAIWQASVEGTGLVTLDFTLPREGDWAVVVMNADGSPGVTADLALGAKVSNVTVIALSQVVSGVCALLAGGLVVIASVLRLRGLVIGLGLAIVGIGGMGLLGFAPYFVVLPLAVGGLVLVVIGMKRARDAQRSEDHRPADHAVVTEALGS